MNLHKKISLAAAATLITTNLSAASLDIREEYKHGGEETAGRIKIGGNAGNHFFGVEMKHSGFSDIENLEVKENEFEYGYRWNVTKQFRVQPSMPITISDGRTTYKPQVRVQYKFDNGITTKLRYRHEFRNFTEESDRDSVNRSKVTANIAYNWNQLQFDLEGNYAEDFIDKEWNDGSNEWDYNLKVGYKIDNTNWRPYIELGNVQCNSACANEGYDSSRQLRSRVGVTYSF